MKDLVVIIPMHEFGKENIELLNKAVDRVKVIHLLNWLTQQSITLKKSGSQFLSLMIHILQFGWIM